MHIRCALQNYILYGSFINKYTCNSQTNFDDDTNANMLHNLVGLVETSHLDDIHYEVYQKPKDHRNYIYIYIYQLQIYIKAKTI